MRFKQFLAATQTSQSYFKEDARLVYPCQQKALRIAILPAYDIMDASPTGFVPAVTGDEESDFYTTVRAAKFVGHGNRRAKVSFLSPKTFDLNADDPYDALYDYCSRSDKWSYLTKDRRGKKLSGEVEGAVLPRAKNFFVANVIDVDAGTQGGVVLTELSEQAGKSILYSLRKNGKRIDGLAFERNEAGELVFGDITDPEGALAIEVAWNGKGYVARPSVYANGNIMRVRIPQSLLQHRLHMEAPETFLEHPGSGQDIVDRLASMLRGYRCEVGEKIDEIHALKEAMDFAFPGKYFVDVEKGEVESPDVVAIPDAAVEIVSAEPAKKAELASEAIERGVEHEKYTPVNDPPPKKERKANSAKKEVAKEKEVKVSAPGEGVDPSDLAALREMLSGGKK